MLGGKGRRPPANPFRSAAAGPADPAQAAVIRDVRWRMFEEGLRDHAGKVARFKASRGGGSD